MGAPEYQGDRLRIYANHDQTVLTFKRVRFALTPEELVAWARRWLDRLLAWFDR